MKRTAVPWILASLALVASCAERAANEGQKPVVASVAASTMDAMEDIGLKFHADAGIEVKINAGSTNALATQILSGAPADVFLSASSDWADKVAHGGFAAERVDLLTNKLVVVVPRGNPASIQRPANLASPAVKKLALAGENVPAGQYAGQALSKLELLDKLEEAGKIVRGQDVRAALSFVERGEAEAGVVYATDVAAAKNVETACEFDPALHDEIVYVLVLVKGHGERPEAKRLYDFMLTDDARKLFAKRGFVPLLETAGR